MRGDPVPGTYSLAALPRATLACPPGAVSMETNLRLWGGGAVAVDRHR